MQLEGFEAKQVKIDGGPAHKWSYTPQRSTPPAMAGGGTPEVEVAKLSLA